MDLFSRKIIGWSISNRHNVDLTTKAFKKAYFDRGEPEYVLFHSDRGSEYTVYTFKQALENRNVVQSFSQKGYPYDNGCCESFFRHMKRECINRVNLSAIRMNYAYAALNTSIATTRNVLTLHWEITLLMK